MEDPVVPLERNMYGHPLAGLIMGEAIRENSIGTRLGTSSGLGMLICKPRKKGPFLVCVCGRYKTGWEETKH